MSIIKKTKKKTTEFFEDLVWEKYIIAEEIRLSIMSTDTPDTTLVNLRHC